jgi:hypothetical protein
MNQDRWTHTTTRAMYGTTSTLGSPRGWLRRAFDSANTDFTTFQPGSLTPTEISVAGIWYRPCSIPVTGMHRELYRWFEIPEARLMRRPAKSVPHVPVIGMCAAVPMHEVMHWLKVYADHGATFVWWKTPVDNHIRASDSTVTGRRKVDYERVFELLNSGMTRKALCETLDLTTQNADYAIKKWHAHNQQ